MRETAHFQQHASGYFAYKHLPLVEKNLQFNGFSGCKLPSSRQGLNHWFFFCAALTYEFLMNGVTGVTQ